MGGAVGKYEGEYNSKGRRHGVGICAFPNRTLYEGEWNDGEIDGEGKLSQPDGTVYEGPFTRGLQNGWGRLSRANGDVYEGEFRGGKMDGYGRYTYANGSLYEGEFLGGNAEGVGVLTTQEGERYEGEWQSDKMHGNGVYRFSGGATYAGAWKFGKMDGFGVYMNVDGSKFMGKYEGQFLGGCMDGLGMYSWPDGDIYVGEYARDRRHGVGVYTSTSSAEYRGQYKAGVREGWGEYTNSKGDVYEGAWKGDVQHGNGILTMSESEETDERRQQQAKDWANVWFKQSNGAEDDVEGPGVLDIDPTRTFAGRWLRGEMVNRRPYRFQDWYDTQAHVSVAVDNAAQGVQETHKAVKLARKTAEFSHSSAEDAQQRVMDEAVPKDAYFIKLKKIKQAALKVEDEHFIRLGPAVVDSTFLAMLTKQKADEMIEDVDLIQWVLPVDSGKRSQDLSRVLDGALKEDVKVRRWLQRARKRQHQEGAWSSKMTSMESKLGAGVGGGKMAFLKKVTQMGKDGQQQQKPGQGINLGSRAIRGMVAAIKQDQDLKSPKAQQQHEQQLDLANTGSKTTTRPRAHRELPPIHSEFVVSETRSKKSHLSTGMTAQQTAVKPGTVPYFANPNATINNIGDSFRAAGTDAPHTARSVPTSHAAMPSRQLSSERIPASARAAGPTGQPHTPRTAVAGGLVATGPGQGPAPPVAPPPSARRNATGRIVRQPPPPPAP